MATLSRKTVTVLFSDVVDSTPMAEALDPESVRALMARYFDEMRVVIERHGGTVEKYIGDAIMAVFGIPQVHEDDALRAVRAAAEMREALARLNDELGRGISARTALNTGEVVAGDGHTLVTGDPVNVAARLEQTAGPGEILIGASTYELVRDAVLAEPVEPLEVKGKAAPVEAWRVTAVLPATHGRERRHDADLVGREFELALLRQAFARVVGQRACHLFTILGTAGVGKSRLANELVREVRRDALTLVGRCLAYGEGITFWPLREIVHALGDLADFVPPREAELVRAVIGGGDVAPPPEDVFRAIRRLVEAIAHDRPLVLGFDDVQWGDTLFLDLVDYLADTVRSAPVLVVCLARPELLEERPTWGGGKVNATTILLEPLDAAESERLVDVLGGDGVPSHLRQTISQTAEGNPLFLSEMVAMALEDPAATTVPPTIHALLTARLERLAPDERRALGCAAVAGRLFSRDAVALLAGDDVDAQLDALERKELIRPQPVSFTAGHAYRFRHILIRDAAYDALPKRDRARMHEQLAAWLASAGTDVDELVGWHLERAYWLRADLGDEDAALAARACRVLGASGRRALSRGDHAAATTLLQRAVDLPGPPDELHVELLVDLAMALEDRGELARAEELLGEARDRALALGDARLEARVAVERLFVVLHTTPADWMDDVPQTEQAIAALEAAGDDAGLARAWLLAVILDYIRCRTRDLEAALEPALRYARRTNDRRHISMVLNASVRAALFSPLPVDEALAHCDRVLELGGDDQLLFGVVHGVRACLLAMAGRFDEARASYLAGHAILDELGRGRTKAVQRAYSGTVELFAGDAVAAERELRAGVDALERIGDRSNLATMTALLAQALGAQGRAAEARTYADISRRFASNVDVISQIEWRVAVAELTDDVELAREAVALAAETDSIALQADAALALGRALAARGDERAAAEATARARELYEAKGNVVGAERAARPSRAAIVPSGVAPTDAGT